MAFVVDVFSLRLVGWRQSSLSTTLNRALYERLPSGDDGPLPVHHSDRGLKYLSMRYSERQAETINGLYKAR